MLLSDIAKIINCERILYFNNNNKIKFISSNSKSIKKNSIFVCNFKKKIKKNYLKEAITKGVIGIITNKLIHDINIPQFKVKNI